MKSSGSRVTSYLLRLIGVILIVGGMAWFVSDEHEPKEGDLVRAELMSLFLEEGLITTPTTVSALSDLAKKTPKATLNRLLYTAAPTASLQALQWLVKHGADPKDIAMVTDRPLLQRVAKVSGADRLEYFLGFDLDPMELSPDGLTLLHVAAEGGLDAKVLKLLLSNGLNLNSATVAGATALHYANLKSVSVLVGAGLSVNAVDRARRTALHYAASKGQNDVVTELIRNGASVFVQDQWGRTPLHLAALSHSSPAIDTLVALGSHRGTKDIEGNTPKDVYLNSLRKGNVVEIGNPNILSKL